MEIETRINIKILKYAKTFKKNEMKSTQHPKSLASFMSYSFTEEYAIWTRLVLEICITHTCTVHSQGKWICKQFLICNFGWSGNSLVGSHKWDPVHTGVVCGKIRWSPARLYVGFWPAPRSQPIPLWHHLRQQARFI